jgi:hypothetical protein
MKLRIARKIWEAIGGPRACRYSGAQKDRACGIMGRTRSQREAHAYWDHLMNDVWGVAGRAELVARAGRPGVALDLLMSHPESEWKYGPLAKRLAGGG